MANVTFHRSTTATPTIPTTDGAIAFNCNSGGIYVGNGSTAPLVASKVSFTRSLSSGTKLGSININGVATELYCQTNTDTKCSYASSSTNAEYPLLFKPSTSTTTTAASPAFDTGITVNPSTNKITASLFKGKLVPTYVGSSGITLSAGFYVVTGNISAGGGITHVALSSAFYYDGSSQTSVACGSQTLMNIAQSTGKVSAASGVDGIQIYSWGA